MVPDFGAAMQVLVFFVVTILQILLCLAVFSYSGHSFLNILINTSAGNDVVQWPKDPYQDWVFKFFYLLWILAVWSVPAALLLLPLQLPLPLLFIGITGVLWLAFPVTLLSSLSASSSWIVLRGLIVGLLLQRAGTLLRFYLSTGVLLALCVSLGYAAALSSYALLVVPAAALGAYSLFVYARLLGRLGWVTSLKKASRRKKEEASRPEEADRVVTFDPWHVAEEPKPAVAPEPRPGPSRKKPARKKVAKRTSRVVDPWAVPKEAPPQPPAVSPEEPEDPLGPARGTYELSALDAPLPSPVNEERLDPDLTGYDMAAPQQIAPVPDVVPPAVAEYEAKLAAPRRPPKLPPRPLLDGVYRFPFYAESSGPLGFVALGLLGIFCLLRLQLELFPPIWK
jgi:hypothetical protein